jgi:type III secretory pathway component EscS
MLQHLPTHNLPTFAAAAVVGLVVLVLIKLTSPKSGILPAAVFVLVLLGVAALVAYTFGHNIYRWAVPADTANESTASAPAPDGIPPGARPN